MSTVTFRQTEKVNLNGISFGELQAMLKRQDKILSNRSFVNNLPDKGEKIKNFREQLVAEMNKYSGDKNLNKNSLSLDVGKKASTNLESNNEHAMDVSIDSKPDAEKNMVLKKLFACSKVRQNFKKRLPRKTIKNKVSTLSENRVLSHNKIQKIQYNGKNEQFESQNVENIKVKNVFQFIDNYVQEKKSHSSMNSIVKPIEPYIAKTISENSKKLSLLQPLHEKKLKQNAIEAQHTIEIHEDLPKSKTIHGLYSKCFQFSKH